MHFLFLSLLLVSVYASETMHPQVFEICIQMPESAKDWQLCIDHGKYSLIKDKESIQIPRWSIEKDLRSMDMHQLAAFAKVGYLRVRKDDKNVSLSSHVRGPGGLLGAAVMSAAGVRAFFYGVPLLAVVGVSYGACNAAGVSLQQASADIDARMAAQAARASAALAQANTPAVSGAVWAPNSRGLDSCEMIDTTFNGERLVMMPDGLVATAHYVNGVATTFSDPHAFGGTSLNAPSLAPTVLAPTVLPTPAPMTEAEALAAKAAIKAAQLVAATGSAAIGMYQSDPIQASLPGVAIAAVELAHDTVVGPTTADQVGTSMVLGGMLGFGKWYVASVEALATAAYIAGMAFPYF